MVFTAWEMTRQWKAAFGDCPAVNYEVRGWFPDRWVRFHNLPDSRQYAENERDYGEILRRERLTLDELVGGDTNEAGISRLIAITPIWSGSATPLPQSMQLDAMLHSEFWKTEIFDDSHPDQQIWLHLWMSELHLDDPATSEVLRLVADEEERLVVVSSEFSWLYAPYAGGADVIARTAAERDILKAAHSEWLPVEPLR